MLRSWRRGWWLGQGGLRNLVEKVRGFSEGGHGADPLQPGFLLRFER